jgi:hypothetical protein
MVIRIEQPDGGEHWIAFDEELGVELYGEDFEAVMFAVFSNITGFDYGR